MHKYLKKFYGIGIPDFTTSQKAKHNRWTDILELKLVE